MNYVRDLTIVLRSSGSFFYIEVKIDKKKRYENTRIIKYREFHIHFFG